jgi:hypothetical protein
LKQRAAKAQVGDPLDPATKVGPLVSAAQLEKVERYVELGGKEGATLLTGGKRAAVGKGKGYFYEPTIFTGARNTMRVAREEIFGPVLTVIPFERGRRCWLRRSDNPYGLAAGPGPAISPKPTGLRPGPEQAVWINTYGLYSRRGAHSEAPSSPASGGAQGGRARLPRAWESRCMGGALG